MNSPFKMGPSKSLRKRNSAITSAPPSLEPLSEDGGYKLTQKLVSYHNTPNDAWVIYKGGVYDITLFLETHPGGADILHDKLGSDVTDAMEGHKSSHSHSPFAYKLLETYKIGKLAGIEDFPDMDGNIDPSTGRPLVLWDKPILHQVGMLGDKYGRWVMSFPTTDHSVRLFPNEFVENLTKCPWYYPLAFWIPICLAEIAHYIYLMGGIRNINPILFLTAGIWGFVFWLLFEYLLHRFVFHLDTSGYYANIFHFLIHGHHHITPMDFDRLVFPPIPALIIGAPFWYSVPNVLGVAMGYPWLFGFVTGYLVYDMTHFWIHYAVPRNSFLKRQKRRHVHHHYFKNTVNFGISNPLFDHVFGTMVDPGQ